MAEKKHSVLAVLEILENESDEEHILTCPQLLQKVEERTGMRLDRRTLYSNIQMLEEFGYSISKFEDNKKGYYLTERKFERSEILLLCNAVHASHFIPNTASRDLVDKLLSLRSRYEQQEFVRKVYLPNHQKTENQELFLNIEMISTAIAKNCMISFTYLTHDMQKNLVPRRMEPYIVEPRYIVYEEGRGYMIATSRNHPGFIHYRLDRMKDVQHLEEKCVRLSTDQDPYEYSKNKLFMFSGDNMTARLVCDASILSHMIDIFGKEVRIIPASGNRFELCISAPKTGILWLAQEYMDAMVIQEPESLREEFKEHMKQVLKRYE